MKGRCLILFLVLCLLFSGNASAQYLNSVSRTSISNNDTVEVLFYFGASEFTSCPTIAPNVKNYLNRKSYTIETRVVNDSCLLLRFPGTKDIDLYNSDTLIFDLVILNVHFEWKTLLNNYPMRILKNNFTSNVSFKAASNQYKYDSIPAVLPILVIGKQTYFTDGDADFRYGFNMAHGTYKFQEVQIISDTLALLYLPKALQKSNAEIFFQYTSNRVGIKRMEGIIIIRADTFLNSPFSISLYPSLVSGNQTQTKNIGVRLFQTPTFNPFQLSPNFIPTLQLAYANQDTLPTIYSPTKTTYDSAFAYKSITFEYVVNIPSYFPSGDLDVIFKHPQLPAYRDCAKLRIKRLKASISGAILAYPGKSWNGVVYDPNETFDSSQTIFAQFSSPGLVLDSVIWYKRFIYLYGRGADSLLGRYDLTLSQGNKEPQTFVGVILINKRLPLLLSFYNKPIFVPGKVALNQMLYANLGKNPIGNSLLPQLRLLKNGSLSEKVKIEMIDSNSRIIPIPIKVSTDTTASSGWYDVEAFDSLSMSWLLQNDFLYVSDAQKVAVDIIPKKYCINQGVGYRNFTIWTKGTHFLTAKDRSAGEDYLIEKVINDTCLILKGMGAYPLLFNEIDGYIGNEFTMEKVDEPSITNVSPNWITPGLIMEYTLHTDVTSWLASPEQVQVYFMKNNEMVYTLDLVSKKVMNDTTLQMQIRASDTLELGLYDIGIYQSDNFLIIKKKEALRALPVGLEERNNPQENVVVFPNPCKGTLSLNADSKYYSSLSITDQTGKLFYQSAYDKNTQQINLDNILPSAGLYILQLNGNKQHTMKLLYQP